MITASLAYSILSKDMTSSLAKVASQSTVKKEAQYYADNINKVKTVDDFLGDYKLYSYAMKAYGLEDMTYAKAFMKKVLESDLSDSSSFANKLSDGRYAGQPVTWAAVDGNVLFVSHHELCELVAGTRSLWPAYLAPSRRHL